MTARFCLLAGVLLVAVGCSSLSPVPPYAAVLYENPVLVPPIDHEFFWNQLVDVIDDYFPIEREQRVQIEGDVFTPGRIDTLPVTGTTLAELGGNSVTPYDKLESTFQSIRRFAVVIVTPDTDGFRVDVAVFKELEDMPRPEFATTESATLRHDTTQPNDPDVITEQPTNAGWMPQGRDPALEQKIIGQLLARVGVLPPFQPLGHGY